MGSHIGSIRSNWSLISKITFSLLLPGARKDLLILMPPPPKEMLSFNSLREPFLLSINEALWWVTQCDFLRLTFSTDIKCDDYIEWIGFCCEDHFWFIMKFIFVPTYFLPFACMGAYIKWFSYFYFFYGVYWHFFM